MIYSPCQIVITMTSTCLITERITCMTLSQRSNEITYIFCKQQVPKPSKTLFRLRIGLDMLWVTCSILLTLVIDGHFILLLYILVSEHIFRNLWQLFIPGELFFTPTRCRLQKDQTHSWEKRLSVLQPSVQSQ